MQVIKHMQVNKKCSDKVRNGTHAILAHGIYIRLAFKNQRNVHIFKRGQEKSDYKNKMKTADAECKKKKEKKMRI